MITKMPGYRINRFVLRIRGKIWINTFIPIPKTDLSVCSRVRQMLDNTLKTRQWISSAGKQYWRKMGVLTFQLKIIRGSAVHHRKIMKWTIYNQVTWQRREWSSVKPLFTLNLNSWIFLNPSVLIQNAGITREVGIDLEDALVAGKELCEHRTNGAAARPVVAAREGRGWEETVREKKC